MSKRIEGNDDEGISLRNCRFAFRCPMKWETLVETEREDIRYCPECDRGVHLCLTDSELIEAVKENWCVAIEKLGRRGTGEADMPHKTVGLIDPSSYFRKKQLD